MEALLTVAVLDDRGRPSFPITVRALSHSIVADDHYRWLALCDDRFELLVNTSPYDVARPSATFVALRFRLLDDLLALVSVGDWQQVDYTALAVHPEYVRARFRSFEWRVQAISDRDPRALYAQRQEQELWWAIDCLRRELGGSQRVARSPGSTKGSQSVYTVGWAGSPGLGKRR